MDQPAPTPEVSSQPAAPPQLSPDGKFYWDGQRWVPMPAAAAPATPVAPAKPGANRLAGGMVLAGGAIAIVGCFLPWISASAFVVTISKDGISSPDGQIIAGLATFSVLFGLLMLARRVGLVVPIVVLLLAAVAMWVVSADYGDLNNRVASLTNSSNSTVTVVAQIGPGIYATGLGILIWGLDALAGFKRSGSK